MIPSPSRALTAKISKSVRGQLLPDNVLVDRDPPLLASQVIDLVDHDEQPRHAIGDIDEPLALGLGERLVSGQHADRHINARKEPARRGGVVLVHGANPRPVDELHAARKQSGGDLDHRGVDADPVLGVAALGGEAV